MNVFGVGLFLVTSTGAWDLAVESGETCAKIVTGLGIGVTCYGSDGGGGLPSLRSGVEFFI